MTESSSSAGAKTRPQTSAGYTVKDLGVLSGDTISSATALNATGQAAGESDTPGSAIGSLFANGVVKNIDTLNAGVSIGEAIDANSQVAGYMLTSPSSPFHAFLYSNGTMQDINNSKLFPAGTQAFGINDSGDVVGKGDVSSSGIFHAFLYAGGKMVDIGTLGGTQGTAYAINDSNQIVGASLTASEVEHAFLYANGKMTDLGLPKGAIATGATAINSKGTIVGTIYPGGGSDAALYSNGQWTNLGNFTGAVGSSATGINTNGQIVGTAQFPNIYHPFRAGKHVAFIVMSGTLIDLNTLIPPGSGFTITDAVGINDSGQIATDAKNSSGLKHAVLLSPK